MLQGCLNKQKISSIRTGCIPAFYQRFGIQYRLKLPQSQRLDIRIYELVLAQGLINALHPLSKGELEQKSQE